MSDIPVYNGPPPQLAGHPIFKRITGIITADSPKFASVSGGNDALRQDLDKMGLRHEPLTVVGDYGEPERSFVVHSPTVQQMYHLGKKFGQEAVIHSKHGVHSLLYTNGPKQGSFNPGLPQVGFHPTQQPSKYWTHLPGRGYFRLHFDFNQLHPDPSIVPVSKRELMKAIVEALKKSLRY